MSSKPIPSFTEDVEGLVQEMLSYLENMTGLYNEMYAALHNAWSKIANHESLTVAEISEMHDILERANAGPF